MKAPKYISLLVTVTVFIAETSLVQGHGHIEEEELEPFALQSSPDPKTLTCFNERVELSSSLIDCLKFQNYISGHRARRCNKNFAWRWKRLSKDRVSRERMKEPAVCPDKPPADAITDLVQVCRKASLDRDECKRLAVTLITLSTIKETKEEGVCPDDEKECPFGEVVYRDPNNNCEFPECVDTIICDEDVQECEDGSVVDRDPTNGCAFRPCTPTEKNQTSTCTKDGFVCPNGDTVVRDPNNNCEFPSCPLEMIVCEEDVQECDNGSNVSRDPNNNCEFPSCPSEITVCDKDVKKCNYGINVSRDPNNNCEFPSCPPEVIVCLQDVKKCDDGSYVSRDPNNNCAFKPCPKSNAE